MPLTKKTIKTRVIEALRRERALLYADLERVVFPSLVEMSDKSILWFREILEELKAGGEIRWQNGEIELRGLESAAFAGAPETTSLRRRPVFRKRK